MEQENRRRDKGTRPYYCICSQEARRYSSYQALHTHIRQKHANGQVFTTHLSQLNKKIVQQRNVQAKLRKSFVLQDIKANKHDQVKLRIITNTIKAINQAYGHKQHAHLLLDNTRTNEEDYLDEDSRGEFCKNDELVELEERKLIQKYSLRELFEDDFPRFAEFEYKATPDEQGKQGQFILMKKELAQHFSMAWAPKFHLQLDIYAALQRKRVEGQLMGKVQSCQEGMWRGYEKIGSVLKQFYKAVLALYIK